MAQQKDLKAWPARVTKKTREACFSLFCHVGERKGGRGFELFQHIQRASPLEMMLIVAMTATKRHLVLLLLLAEDHDDSDGEGGGRRC